jgi:ATP-dependent helicase/nuclease subunit B
MAVQFILGRSGTGKTSYCIRAIVDSLLEPDENQPLLFLVPEQATYQAERAILADRRIAGYHRLNVLSFDRLQFLLLGRNTARPALSRIGQQMIIQRILRDHADHLKLFHSSADRPGLGRQIAQTIIELHQYAKTPEDVDRLLVEMGEDERNNLTVLKFADIGLILREYLKFLEGRFIDPDIQLTRARKAAATAKIAKGAKLWVDGFAGFTAGELAILTELIKVAAEVQIALCLDPLYTDLTNPEAGKIDHDGLFNPTERTYIELVEIIRKYKLPLAEPITLDKAIRFSACPQLLHIERSIFHSRAAKLKTADNIHIVSAPNVRAEVRFVARQILQLVKERDYRYRDIGVIASDIDRYEHYIRAYFEDYCVPFFIDKRKQLSQHAAIQLICSALAVVAGDFSSRDIFAYLKTDLVPIERYDVDLLEGYCIAFGIQGSDWQSSRQWCFAAEDDGAFDQQRINRIRQKVVEPLLVLRDRLRPQDSTTKIIGVEELTRAIFDFLDSLQIRETLGAWIEEAVGRKDYTAVDEHRQFYDKLLNIFDELCEVFAGQKMTLADYLAILNSAFSQMMLAFIPPTLDQVLVGSIERSRHPDLKAVFLIGATQRQFPVPVGFDSILTEDDRNAAESADFSLAATASQKLAQRQYLAYIAFTRPCQFLCVTYPVVDDKGNAVSRSQFIDDIESLFENLSEKSIAGEQIDIDRIHNEMELSELLCSHLGKDTGPPDFDELSRVVKLGAKYLNLLGDMCSDEQFKGLGSRIVSAINYDNRARLDSDVINNFGRRIKSSATRLGTFAACPYRYFARYVLELKEREEFKLEPLDVGVFYHNVLDCLLKRLNASALSFATVEPELLLKNLKEEISKLVTEDSFISNFVRHSAHNAFIIHAASEYLEDCVLAIARMVRAGSFRPRLSEITFGGTESFLGKYELELTDGRLVSLDGKIDRLDIAELNDGKIAVIFDYKRREKSFSWAELYYGLDMQLPIYILAVRNATDSKVRNAVGAFYMPVEVKIKQANLDELLIGKDKFIHKANGIFDGSIFQHLDRNSLKENEFYNFYVTKDGVPYGNYEKRGALRPDDFKKVLKYTEKKIIRLIGEIISGKIDVKPYRLGRKSPCGLCKYKPVCRFDWQINDYNFLDTLNKIQCLEKMGTADA